MKIIEARNVQQALPKGIALLQRYGVQRESRNGPVLVAPWPVVTEYAKSGERVLFWPARDANPAFHLYEALWMLQGRRDLAPLLRYVKHYGAFSDDGRVLHGAYGHRWRQRFGRDQLSEIAQRLTADATDRRSVLQMWSCELDLDFESGKDLPCNTMATFQRNADGELDLTVFCRSNDIIWGCYGANAVHFSMLLEYMANWIGCPMGVYRQISVNWHAYLGPLAKVEHLPKSIEPSFAQPRPIPDPYVTGAVRAVPMRQDLKQKAWDAAVEFLMKEVDADFTSTYAYSGERFLEVCYAVLKAHAWWRTMSSAGAERFDGALRILKEAPSDVDWVVAMEQWLLRRRDAWTQELTT